MKHQIPNAHHQGMTEIPRVENPQKNPDVLVVAIWGLVVI